MESKPSINIEKSSIPILWLDTSIIFNITFWKLGNKIDNKQKERASYLFDSIYKLTRQKKLICPIADQKEEIWNGRNDCLQVMLDLSLGIKSKFSESVKEIQIKQFLESYINDENSIIIKYSDFFHSDPIQQIWDTNEIILNVDLGLTDNPASIKS